MSVKTWENVNNNELAYVSEHIKSIQCILMSPNSCIFYNSNVNVTSYFTQKKYNCTNIMLDKLILHKAKKNKQLDEYNAEWS